MDGDPGFHLERAPSIDAFARSPLGRWVLCAPTAVVFCATPSLSGCVAWGRPTRDDVERIVAGFSAYSNARVAARFDVVLDGRGIEGIDPDALAVLFAWLGERRTELLDRLRVQYGVIADGMTGLSLAGILPMLGETHPFRVVRDPREALSALSPDGGAICDELDRLVAEARDLPRPLRELRELLRSSSRGATIERVARSLKVSVRSLQRALAESGTTFRDEVRDARFAEVQALLVGGDQKVAEVARRLGVSENALTQLVREKAGVTPAELRKQHREGRSDRRYPS
jgi:AraC-like DNA-binding protein